MLTLEKFLLSSEIHMQSEEVAPNGTHGFPIAAPWAAKHYRCELRGSSGDRPVTTIIGSDDGPPSVADVVDVVAAEAAVAEEAGSYEEWALQMGFDPDSRSGERVYRTECRQAKLLRALLGDEAYLKLLWEIERL